MSYLIIILYTWEEKEDVIVLTYEGGHKKPIYLCIKMCIYSYMFKLQSPSKYSPFDATHLSRCFFSPAQNSV